MLKPALLYKEELNKKVVENWDNLDDMYFYYDGGRDVINVANNTDTYCQYVDINKENNVIGYFAYSYDRATQSIFHFGLLSFDKGNLTFIRDVIKHIDFLFKKCNLNRIEWHLYTDNPAIKGYRKFIKRYGGIEVGPLHQSNLLSDGKLHDYVIFEILRENYLEAIKKR